MSEGGRAKPPETKPSAKPEEPAAETVSASSTGRGFAGVRDERSHAVDTVRYRLTGGAEGTAPAGHIASERRSIVGAAAARIMRKASGAAGGAQVPAGGGSPLPADVKGRMEPKLGADLSAVRIHTGSDSAQAASKYGARAFTVGNDVHFNAGQFSPGSKEGDKLIAHELTHVVQGAQSGVQRKPDDEKKADSSDDKESSSDEVSSPEEPAEREADAVAEKTADELHGDDKEAKGEEKGRGKKEGGKKEDAKAAAPSAPIQEKAHASRLHRAEAPTTPEEYGVLRQYTNAVGRLRTGIDEERTAYEDDRFRAGARMGQPREQPESFRLAAAQETIRLAQQGEAPPGTDVIERQRFQPNPRLSRLGATLVAEKQTLLRELTRMRECAELAKSVKDMTQFRALFGGVAVNSGITMQCDALRQAQRWVYQPWRQAMTGLEPFRQGNQAAPSAGAAQAHNFRFADGSRIRLDVPRLVPGGRNFEDGDRPHMAIYPPNDNVNHLSLDGVVVPAGTATAHIPLLPA